MMLPEKAKDSRKNSGLQIARASFKNILFVDRNLVPVLEYRRTTESREDLRGKVKRLSPLVLTGGKAATRTNSD